MSGFLTLFLVILAFIKNPNAAAIHDLVGGSRSDRDTLPFAIQGPCFGKRCVLVPDTGNCPQNIRDFTYDLCMHLSERYACDPSSCPVSPDVSGDLQTVMQPVDA